MVGHSAVARARVRRHAGECWALASHVPPKSPSKYTLTDLRTTLLSNGQRVFSGSFARSRVREGKGSVCGAVAGRRAPPGSVELRSRRESWFQFVTLV